MHPPSRVFIAVDIREVACVESMYRILLWYVPLPLHFRYPSAYSHPRNNLNSTVGGSDRQPFFHALRPAKLRRGRIGCLRGGVLEGIGAEASRNGQYFRSSSVLHVDLFVFS